MLNRSDKKDLKRSDKYVASLVSTIHEKTPKSGIKTINLKYQPQYAMMNLTYLTDHTLCQIFKFILSILNN